MISDCTKFASEPLFHAETQSETMPNRSIRFEPPTVRNILDFISSALWPTSSRSTATIARRKPGWRPQMSAMRAEIARVRGLIPSPLPAGRPEIEPEPKAKICALS
jgi:hypothetical protein